MVNLLSWRRKYYRFYGSYWFFVFLLFCIIHFVSYRLCVSYTFSSHPNCMQVILFAVAFIAIGGSGQQVRAKVLTTSQGHHSKSKVCTEKICCFHSFLSVQLYLRELLIFTSSEKGLKFCKLTKFRRVGGLAQAGTGPWGRASAASRWPWAAPSQPPVQPLLSRAGGISTSGRSWGKGKPENWRTHASNGGNALFYETGK